MDCLNCSFPPIQYEIHFEGEANIKMLPVLHKHIKRQNGWALQNENILVVMEESVLELFDFCIEHMLPDRIFYRIHGTSWDSFSTISSVIEAQWIDDLIAQKKITPFFQPIVDQEGNIFGHEILSRSLREDGTFIPPNELFLSAKKRNRLFALDRLCRLTAVQHSAVLKNQKIFINFLPTSIYSPEHCLRTTLELARTIGVNPANFVFEVVESENVEDTEHLKNILHFYKQQGFEYALDDVGEGFSTVELLKELQPAYMKLDMKYVQGVCADSQKQEMACKILQAALEAGSIPLAEGIESNEDFDYLKKQGFQLFQGYLFGKPAPAPLQSFRMRA
ncbi:EAL domain-containing protein [Brevibacillus centrosporus]|uniref:EAL domain-containing protein n=1 Tax=Brevibacillus centrosporus TaxID=54910 RepID=UPI003815F033